ncbi:muramoyltetrapeptide carboxypeptidase [Spiroplasma chinense]|uniref:Muramoyltetrapeptide carboxypeptidase n=1 Tax=Spiroplasma chinense TaxID=216932 RepID=A0A5B9Y6X0_9MOLU|nr:LD-carboxypeptidase [Spiroplasma chinense]QEH61832.1 muramoyltetrapeptide carboxypeptidase [Spiroplasma chinense]
MKLGLFHPSEFLKDNKKEYREAVEFFKQKGFNVIEPDEKSKKYTTNVALAFEFNKMIKRNPEVILPTYCLENTNSILELIDYKGIRKTKTTFFGNSYVTTILNAIVSKTNNSVFYGPNLIRQFSSPERETTYIDLVDNLTNSIIEKGEFDDDNKLINDWKFEGTGTVKGILFGGEIESLIKMWDSQYMPKLNSNNVVFIDGIPDDIYEVESILTFLQHKQVFSKPKAIIFAKALIDNELLKEKVAEKLDKKSKVKFVYGVDGMFSDEVTILKLNAPITIDFENKKITQKNK